MLGNKLCSFNTLFRPFQPRETPRAPCPYITITTEDMQLGDPAPQTKTMHDSNVTFINKDVYQTFKMDQ